MKTSEQMAEVVKRLNERVNDPTFIYAFPTLVDDLRVLLSDYDRVMESTFKTNDGYHIDPLGSQVYYYAPCHTDGYPTHGRLEFDEHTYDWFAWKPGTPVFYKRESVDKFIIQEHVRRGIKVPDHLNKYLTPVRA